MAIFNRNKHSQKRRVYSSNQQIEIPIKNATINVHTYQQRSQEPGDIPGGMFEKCPDCGKVVFGEDLVENLQVCVYCNHHFRLPARRRVDITADQGSFVEFNENLVGANPLDYPGYEQKLDQLREKTGLSEAIVTGTCAIGGFPCVLAVMDGFFMMGSMGAALGEKFTRAAEVALEKRLPFVVFTVSGGARMQEGLISLMQMAKTSAVLAKLDEAGLAYIVVLTDATTGGVTASFAMLGDVTLAEPNATIGFAGKRVIEQTIKQSLPEGFQRSEFLMKKGFIDCIIERKDLRETLTKILKLHAGVNQNG
ncbi:MAG: acetyl-CoA carboxylase, carboxyltransferase subunit beta [Eubacteriales bacterium]